MHTHTAAHSNSSGTRTRLNVTLTHSAENRVSRNRPPQHTRTLRHIHQPVCACCREAVTKTSLTLRFLLSEVYLLFVYVSLLFVVCLLLQSHSSTPFTSDSSPPSLFLRSAYPFFLSELELLGRDRWLPFCTGHSEAVDRLVALAVLPWQWAVCFAEVTERHWEQRRRHSRAVLHGGLVDEAQS